MALIKCPDCGKEHSDLASACPNCARPVAQANTPAQGKSQTVKQAMHPSQWPTEPSSSTHCPWSRYFARHFDLTVGSLLIGVAFVLLGFFLPIGDWLYSGVATRGDITIRMMLGGAIFIPLSFVVLAVIFNNFGSTPGKWLLGISVTKKDGTVPTFGEIFNREFNVFMRGYALGVPLVMAISSLWQYSKLSKHGETSYDRDLGFVVTKHSKGGLGEGLVFFGLVLATLSIPTASLSLAGMMHKEIARKYLPAQASASQASGSYNTLTSTPPVQQQEAKPDDRISSNEFQRAEAIAEQDRLAKEARMSNPTLVEWETLPDKHPGKFNRAVELDNKLRESGDREYLSKSYPERFAFIQRMVEEEYLKSLVEQAKNGDAIAQYNLGLMYYKGQGVPRDFAKALKWYRKAAEQGNSHAQYNIALKYYDTTSVSCTTTVEACLTFTSRP